MLYAVLDGLRKRLAAPVGAVRLAAIFAVVQALLAALIFVAEDRSEPWLHDPAAFTLAALASGLINVFASVLYVSAVSRSPLSLTVPYLSLSPALLLVAAALFLGEVPSLRGALGVLLVAGGAFFLNGAGSLSARLRAIVSEPGTKRMLVVAALWTVSTVFDRIGLRAGPTSLFIASASAVMALPLLVAARRAGAPRLDRPTAALVGVAAVVLTLAVFLQFASYEHLLTSYTIAIKRAGMLVSIVIGHFAFGDEDLGRRLPAAAVMALGVALVVLG